MVEIGHLLLRYFVCNTVETHTMLRNHSARVKSNLFHSFLFSNQIYIELEMEQLALEIAHWQILDMQLKKLTEGKFVSVHEESSCDEKMKTSLKKQSQ